MHIKTGYEMEFEAPAPVPMVAMLYTHPSRAGSLLLPDELRVEPEVPVQTYFDSFGNRCARFVAPAGKFRLTSNSLVTDSGEPDPVSPNARQHPVEELPPEVMPFLLASRYCEVDLLSDLAWNTFGQTAPGWGRVAAVCEWVHNHVEFGYAYSRPTKTAAEVYQERRGVCRDFQHLSITLLRALNIPARYATGYLGDIGVPFDPNPMDFSAWFEAYLDGKWWTFDARHNKPRIGRILMATGRDATDVALTTQFGSACLTKFIVVTDEVPG